MAMSRAPWLWVFSILVGTPTSFFAYADPLYFNRASGGARIYAQSGNGTCDTGQLSGNNTAECSWSADNTNIAGTQSADGNAYADLETGVAFARAESSDTGESNEGVAAGGSLAEFSNVLTFDVPAGLKVATVGVTTETKEAGLSLSAGEDGSASGYIAMAIFDGNNGNSFVWSGKACSPNISTTFGCNDVSGDAGGLVSFSDTYLSVSAKLDLTKYDKLRFLFLVEVQTAGNASAYVSDPITITVTPGVTWTAASGAFLTGSVPEPATWLLLTLGFISLGFAGYRASHKAAAAAVAA